MDSTPHDRILRKRKTKEMTANSSEEKRGNPNITDSDSLETMPASDQTNINSPRHRMVDSAYEMGFSFKETSLTNPLLQCDSDLTSSMDGVIVANTQVEGVTIVATPEPKHPQAEEKSWQIGLQVFIPYMIAGFGMVGAGLVLDLVQTWAVFKHVPEVFILVPSLLGLKGNLEMTLASRLSTQANLGTMDIPKEQWKMILGNLALTQAQAIVVGFFASVFAMVLGWIPKGKFNWTDAFLLSGSSVLTASGASFVLGSVMIGVIIVSRKLKINPDNVATPIAASLGDLTTLAVLASVSNVLYKSLEKEWWLSPLLLVIFLALVPLWCVVSHRNKYVHDVLYNGWVPVVGAMLISSVGGLILDFAVKTYKGVAVFQPVINGVGGNLVAVQASRLSTYLHLNAEPGKLPAEVPHGFPNPLQVFMGGATHARTARVLLLLVLPGQIVFMLFIHYHMDKSLPTLLFSVLYLTACFIQVIILLYLAVWLVHYLWRRKCDPDNYSIPYLTALGDLLGGFLLALAFHILSVFGDKDG